MDKSKQTTLDNYHSKEVLSNVCSEIIENLLIKTYEEENPFKNERPKKSQMMKQIEDQLPSMLPRTTLRRTRKKISKYQSLPEEVELDSITKNEILPMVGMRNTPEIRYIQNVQHDNVNPFKDLLAQNESFFYQNNSRKNRFSNNTLQHEEDDLEEQYHSSYEFACECGTQNIEKRDTNTITDICGGLECIPVQQHAMMINNTQTDALDPFIDLHEQVDHERIENLEYMYTLSGNRCNALNVRVNFSFYAKLLAFLLTINTLFFFKSVICTYLIPYLDLMK